MVTQRRKWFMGRHRRYFIYVIFYVTCAECGMMVEDTRVGNIVVAFTPPLRIADSTVLGVVRGLNGATWLGN
jgi:hypothetical protein